MTHDLLQKDQSWI